MTDDEWKSVLIAALHNKPTDRLLNAVATAMAYACDSSLMPDGNRASMKEAMAINFVEATVEEHKADLLRPDRRIEGSAG